MITKQQTFDLVAPALLRQGEKSTDGSTCKYRGPNGLKCAAGFCIPDDRYSHSMEKAMINADGASNQVSRLLYELGYNLNFLLSLQLIHDVSPVDSWKQELLDLAEDNGLDASCIKDMN